MTNDAAPTLQDYPALVDIGANIAQHHADWAAGPVLESMARVDGSAGWTLDDGRGRGP